MYTSRMWFVYVLYSRPDDRCYVGVTNDINRRLSEHSHGKTHTTLRMKELELVYYGACFDKADATHRERQLKTGFGRGYIRKRIENYMRTLSSAG